MASQMPTSPLTEAVSSLSVEPGTNNVFSSRISRQWTTQHSVLGGFLNALMLSATRKYIELEFPDKHLPDPIHVFVQFLSMAPPGNVRIACNCLRVSSRQCVVRVELYRQRDSQSPSQSTDAPSTAAIVTYGNIANEKGLTQDTKPPISAPLPKLETECVHIDDPVVDATPVTRKLHWVAPKSAKGLWGHRLGGHHREVWLSFRDGSRIASVFHLAMLADMPLQPPATHEHGFYLRYALSTLCLSVEFKKRPDPNTQWVMVRSNSTKVSNGRYDTNVQILDQDGDVLALSNHVLYISELRQPAKM